MNSPDQPAPRMTPVPSAPPGDSHPSPRLGLWLTWIILLVVVAALAGLVPRWRERRDLRRETAELAIPTVLVVSPVPAKAAGGPALSAEVKALTEAPIYARANGYLKRWLVDLGAHVEAGQLLAEIETPELDQELARARAELAQAEAALALSKTTSARYAELLRTASVSEQETAEKQADLALKSAIVDGARANVHRLTEVQSFARVTAPFAGTITLRRTDVGELVTAPSGRELFRLADTSRLRIYVRVPQTILRAISPGQMAELSVPELPGRVFAAKVVRTAGAIDAQSRTLLVELELDNPRGELLAGGYAQVRFTEAKLDAALTLPSNTLLFRAEGPQVGVVSGDGKVELRTVLVGRDFGATVEVISGVSAADLVILNPSDSLVGGAVVRVGRAPAAGTPK